VSSVALTNTSISSPSSSESAIARGMVHVVLKFGSISRSLKVHRIEVAPSQNAGHAHASRKSREFN
jgi:hypothetical protein